MLREFSGQNDRSSQAGSPRASPDLKIKNSDKISCEYQLRERSVNKYLRWHDQITRSRGPKRNVTLSATRLSLDSSSLIDTSSLKDHLYVPQPTPKPTRWQPKGRRIFAEGHTIGTHSEDHPARFGRLPAPLVEWEIDKGFLDVGAALDDPRQVAPFFRVPGLARSDVIESELAARVLIDFGSDTVADDWHHRVSPKKIIALAMNRLKARGKGILLLHDIHPATVAALPGLLKELRQRDFHVVHVVPISIDQF